MAAIENAEEILGRWPARWPGINAPSAVTVRKTYKKLQAKGTCHNLHKSCSERLRTACSDQNIERVREELIEDGSRSSRRNGLGLPQSSFVRIAKSLKFHPYCKAPNSFWSNALPVPRVGRYTANKLLQTVTEHEMWFAKINQTYNKYLSTRYQVISRFEQIFQKYRKLKVIISYKVIEEKKAKQNSQSICLRSYKDNSNMLCGLCSLPGVPVDVLSIRTLPSD